MLAKLRLLFYFFAKMKIPEKLIIINKKILEGFTILIKYIYIFLLFYYNQTLASKSQIKEKILFSIILVRSLKNLDFLKKFISSMIRLKLSE